MLAILIRSLRQAAGLGPLLALLNGGCSSSDDGGVGLVSEAQFPERFATTWCQSIAPCCASARADYEPMTCQAQARDFAAALLAARVDDDVSYSASEGTRCLARLERALASCEIDEASTACASIFVGALREGSPCGSNSACASGYCASSEAASGVCREAIYQAPTHGKTGDPCVGSCGVPGSFACPTSLLPSAEGTITYCYADDGLYCAFDADALALSCQRYAAVAEACTDANCVPGTFCTDGTCVAQISSGSCASTADLCDVRSYCDRDQQCQPKQPNGSPCSAGEECLSSSCSSEGACDSGSTSTVRACSGAP